PSTTDEKDFAASMSQQQTLRDGGEPTTKRYHAIFDIGRAHSHTLLKSQLTVALTETDLPAKSRSVQGHRCDAQQVL
ncbi:hypothetical protein ACC771_08330, partial [Rhizobium ruizarguesonis]